MLFILFQRKLNFSTASAAVHSDESDTSVTTVHVEELLLTKPDAESTCTESGIVENYDSAGDSVLHTSLMLHDYCGAVDRGTLSTHMNKCEQTDPNEGIEPLCGKTFSDASVQCNIKLTSTSTMVQTENVHAKASVETCTVGIQTNRPDLAFEDIKHSDEKVMFYTGLPNAGTFHTLFDEMSDAFQNTQRKDSGGTTNGRPRMLQLAEEFFLVLMRLRLGLLLEDLAGRFHISKSTCGCLVSRWIDYLHVKLVFLTPWPTRSIIQNSMPQKFRKKYPKCRVIIDCTEIFTETPQSLCNKTLMYSHYKTHMTYKALLGISPSGIITFVSDLWGGSISDKQITRNSGLLDLCERGDAIMADKGFVISDLTTPKGIHLIVPPFKYKRFNRREIEETRRIANLRIDVERAMERVKNFRILQGTMPITMASQASKIWKICVGLSNLQPPLIHDETD